jgi:hypothetical protein
MSETSTPCGEGVITIKSKKKIQKIQKFHFEVFLEKNKKSLASSHIIIASQIATIYHNTMEPPEPYKYVACSRNPHDGLMLVYLRGTVLRQMSGPPFQSQQAPQSPPFQCQQAPQSPPFQAPQSPQELPANYFRPIQSAPPACQPSPQLHRNFFPPIQSTPPPFQPAHLVPFQPAPFHFQLAPIPLFQSVDSTATIRGRSRNSKRCRVSLPSRC